MHLVTDRHFPLRDGRVAGYAECGDPAGLPVYYCHGLPSSRLEIALEPVASAAERAGVRLIAMDRPGLGESSPKLRRTILDWTIDLADVAGGLGHERFCVLGVSGGAPYAIATALRLPERVEACGVVAGIAPLSVASLRRDLPPRARRMLRLARWLPWLLDRPLGRMAEALARGNGSRLAEYLGGLPDVDRAVLDDPIWREALLGSWREALRRGTDGVKQDLMLAARPWGFPLDQVRLPVNLWLGGADRNVPPAMGRYLADRLPFTESRYYPAEGHLSLVARRAEAILRELVQAAKRNRASRVAS